MIPKKTFSVDQLKKYMIEKGISQQDLAKKIGITPAALSKILSGRNLTKVATVQKIAKALDVSVGYLIGSNQSENNDIKKIFKSIEKLSISVDNLNKKFDKMFELLKK